MAKPDLRTLRAEAQELLAKGKLRKATEAYLLLDAAEPSEGGWPHKVGELYLRQDDPGRAVPALVRASERYARAGFLVKAIAVCKLILRVDPGHSTAQAQIAHLNRERLGTPSSASARGGGGEVARELQAGRPIEATSIGGLHGARSVAQGIAELELDDGMPIDLVDDASIDPVDRERVRAALDDTPFVAVLGERALARLIEAAVLVELDAEQILFRQGDPGDTLYVVESGEVVASREGPPRRDLGRLGDGAVFGEIALLSDQPRSATITATRPSRLVAFDRRAVGEMLAAEPAATGLLLGFLRQRLLVNLIASSPLFEPFPPSERKALAARFRLAEAEPGTVLVETGTRARGLHVILAGGVDVERDGAPVAALTTGDVFGEISLLEGNAVATVRARTKTLLLVLPAAEFREIIMTHPQILAYVSELADARKALLGREGPGAGDVVVDLHLDFV